MAWKFFTSAGAQKTSSVQPELVYNEFTATVTFTATTEAAATTIVTASAFTADGTSAYLIECYIPTVTGAAGNYSTLVLYEDGASIGKLCNIVGVSDTVTSSYIPVRVARRRIPAAGSRTYSIRGYASNASQATAVAGVGGSGAVVPGFIRITKVT